MVQNASEREGGNGIKSSQTTPERLASCSHQVPPLPSYQRDQNQRATTVRITAEQCGSVADERHEGSCRMQKSRTIMSFFETGIVAQFVNVRLLSHLLPPFSGNVVGNNSVLRILKEGLQRNCRASLSSVSALLILCSSGGPGLLLDSRDMQRTGTPTAPPPNHTTPSQISQFNQLVLISHGRI